jgi:RNA recognition motif-containing protein
MMHIYVGNLSEKITEEDLRKAFSSFGRVIAVRILKQRGGGDLPRGYGFVEMPGRAEAQNAVEGLNGKPMKGKPLKVSIAHSRYQGIRGEKRPAPTLSPKKKKKITNMTPLLDPTRRGHGF